MQLACVYNWTSVSELTSIEPNEQSDWELNLHVSTEHTIQSQGEEPSDEEFEHAEFVKSL